MNENVELMPSWKNNATAEDRFNELALMARKNPEKFNNFIVVYQEETATSVSTRYTCSQNIDTNTALGILELAKHEIITYVSGE